MSRYDDDRYVDEITDAAAERLLTGRSVPEHPELSGIVGALRAEANGPAPAPSAALAALLRDGFTPPAAAPAAPPPRARLLSRVTGLGLLAKSTVAAGAAVFVVAGAGAAGALPGASQDVFADVVNAVTPFRVGATERPAEADADTDEEPAETPAPEDEATEQPDDDDHAEPAPETAAPDDAETPAPSDEPTADAEPDDADASEEPVTDESEEYEDPDDAEWGEEPADDEEYEEDPAEEGDPEEEPADEEPADEEEPDDEPTGGGLLRVEY